MKTRIKIGESRLDLGYKYYPNPNEKLEDGFDETKELVIGAMEVEIDCGIDELTQLWELKKKMAKESDEVIKDLEEAIFGAITRIQSRIEGIDNYTDSNVEGENDIVGFDFRDEEQ